jgi:hypothetical protein
MAGRKNLAGNWPKLNTCYRAIWLEQSWLFGWGRRPCLQQADDPCRAIKIVAHSGQLYATGRQTPDRDRTRYSNRA